MIHTKSDMSFSMFVKSVPGAYTGSSTGGLKTEFSFQEGSASVSTLNRPPPVNAS